MILRRILKFGLPFGGGLELMAAGGAAYFAWEHEQGKHAQANLLCPICWLNKIAPAAQPRPEAAAATASPTAAGSPAASESPASESPAAAPE